jgi:hypothetical protein
MIPAIQVPFLLPASAVVTHLFRAWLVIRCEAVPLFEVCWVCSSVLSYQNRWIREYSTAMLALKVTKVLRSDPQTHLQASQGALHESDECLISTSI